LALLPKSAANAGEETAFSEAISEMANYGITLFVPEAGRVIAAPTYPFLGEKLWLEPKTLDSREMNFRSPDKALPASMTRAPAAEAAAPWQKKLADSLAQISGHEPHELLHDVSWMSLGLDSMLLTQWSLKMQKEWGINMNVNMLQNELQNLQSLALHLQSLLPQETLLAVVSPPPTTPMTTPPDLSMSATLDTATISGLLQQQMALMSKQIELITCLMGQRAEVTLAAVRPPPVQAMSADEIKSKVTIATTPETLAAAPNKLPTEPLPDFLNHLVHEGEIAFANDLGVLRLPHYRGAFLALDSDGQPGLFIENPDQSGEYWQVLGA
jgi:hypothetical protein